jgi:hypothetical protein
MPLYTIIAKRETLYEFNIEAGSEQEAIDEINRIEIAEDVEEYAYDWYPLEVTEIEEEGEVE